MIESAVPSCDVMPLRAGTNGLMHLARFTKRLTLREARDCGAVLPSILEANAWSDRLEEELLSDWDWVE